MDTLHIHHDVYTAYAPWRTRHAYVELHMQSNITILAVYILDTSNQLLECSYLIQIGSGSFKKSDFDIHMNFAILEEWKGIQEPH